MNIKKKLSKALTNTVQFFANGLSQSATDRDGEKKSCYARHAGASSPCGGRRCGYA